MAVARILRPNYQQDFFFFFLILSLRLQNLGQVLKGSDSMINIASVLEKEIPVKSYT